MSSWLDFVGQIRNLSCARPLGSCIHEVELSLNEKKKENLYVLEEEAKRQSVGNEGPDVNAKDSYPQNSSESDTVWNEHGPWKTELGTKKTPKGGYQSKRKEILFLIIDSYR